MPADWATVIVLVINGASRHGRHRFRLSLDCGRRWRRFFDSPLFGFFLPLTLFGATTLGVSQLGAFTIFAATRFLGEPHPLFLGLAQQAGLRFLTG